MKEGLGVLEEIRELENFIGIGEDIGPGRRADLGKVIAADVCYRDITMLYFELPSPCDSRSMRALEAKAGKPVDRSTRGFGVKLAAERAE
jgi:hypothetical protein